LCWRKFCVIFLLLGSPKGLLWCSKELAKTFFFLLADTSTYLVISLLVCMVNPLT
jgi:hypothetical protein